MKLLSFTILLVAIVALMVFTNPTLDDYSNHIRERIVSESKDGDERSKNLAVALGGIAGYFISNGTTRENYLVFSIYRTEIGPQRMKCIGLLGNFVGCEDFSSKEPDE